MPLFSTSDAREAESASSTAELLHSINDIRSRLDALRSQGRGPVALVPTMGSFHEGHLSLMRAARAAADLVVVSIFVNPIQFGPAEDYDVYPRDFESDVAQAATAGVDLIFAPAATDMYPAGHETMVKPGATADGLCGQSRPDHFTGVATVVAKLFNILQPDQAYFGQKDAQQVAVIRRMTIDLDFAVDIRVGPVIREPDGLAMSSRNTFLSAEEREQATVLYRALDHARERVAAGETGVSGLRRRMRKEIAANYLVELEYVRIMDPLSMEPVASVSTPVVAAVAAKVGNVRLIDNMLLSSGDKA
ncbi:MAG: pantoate--beta-alanine ligase [Thermoleophilia bacterium]